jgi:diguanylate cyclase (GGDEF)-like protein
MIMNGSFSILYIDVDFLASINERYGRPTGDRLLEQLGERLRAVSPSGHILIRLHGDEFMLVLTLEDIDRLSRIANMLLHCACCPIHIDGQTIETSVSIGGALHPHHGRDIPALMRHAEFAMRQVKAGGRNGYHLFNSAESRLIN